METEADSAQETPPSTSRSGRLFLVMIGVLVGGFFLYLTARNVDLQEAMAIMVAIDKLWVLPLMMVIVLTQSLRCCRWYLMFPEESRPRFRYAIDALMMGKMGNNFMPGRLGDVLRASIIAPQVPNAGVSGALATVVLEKVLDSLLILIFMGFTLLLIPLPEWMVKSGSIAIVLFLGLLISLWFFNRSGLGQRSEQATQQVNFRGAGLLRLAGRLLQKFSVGLYALQEARHFILLSVFTLLIWSLEIVMFYLLFQAFGITASLLAAMVCLVFLCVGLMLPAAPGFIGTYQLFIVAALQLFDVPDTTAFALAVFFNLFTIVMTTVIGVVVVCIPGGLFNFSALRHSLMKG
ncbi:MAG: hypothetical protein ACI9JM_000620 [Halioglobus sp.]|jgi:uncharacterized protein (TIRG00374 family)